MSTALYFIALIPPKPIYSEVYALKQEMGERFKSTKALQSPPHITLCPPFKMDNALEKDISILLTSIVSFVSPFEVVLDNFGSFENRRVKKPVIYVHPQKSIELHKLQQALNEEITRKFNFLERVKYSFNPHMTIAYRDLTIEAYDIAWPEIKERRYERKFMANYVSLLKFNYDKRGWDVLKNCIFHCMN